MKGKLIVFEGLDGSGQTTQCELLSKYLNGQGHKTILTKEPTNNFIGGLIRAQLTHEWESNQETLQLLFAADRAHHLEKVIEPALKHDMNVISDRYFFSSIAYGSVLVDKEWLKRINEKFRLPDYTFFLKVSPKVCLERISKQRFEFELFEKEEYLKNVYENYLILSKEYKNFYVIDGEDYVENIHKNVLDIVKKQERL